MLIVDVGGRVVVGLQPFDLFFLPSFQTESDTCHDQVSDFHKQGGLVGSLWRKTLPAFCDIVLTVDVVSSVVGVGFSSHQLIRLIPLHLSGIRYLNVT
jgi:hypothetical protein